ncbi:MAG: TonB-dependent receptor plug domain-containing protein, partial [candidate division Zixibacteria bacterium]|nr:TonB-dependent receptor plug domain-containing protein [candidate division Zixibacteria bacterium]
MKKSFSYECLHHLFLLNSKIVHLFIFAGWDQFFLRKISAFRSNHVALTLFLTIIFNLLFFAHLGFAQSNIKIEGHVYDHDDGHPIPKAIIRILNTNYECKSDNSGYFHLQNIPLGSYTLEVSSLGYENQKIPQVIVNVDVTTQINVRLKKRICFLPGLTVTAERIPLQIKSIKTIERTEIEKMQVHTVSEVIESAGGVFVQKSGTVAGVHRVSIRGSSPKHVLILLDGQKINPSGSGVADLNTIPLEMVEKIEILKGGQSAIYGADALGGVVNIITLPQKRKASSRLTLGNHWGKWETEIFNS